MFLDETIDPDIPTDPNDLALYKRYGRNWRNVVMGSTVRDRGGNFDRGMRFMHSTPEGFMQRPNTQQVQQSNIDQSGYFAQLQKLQDEYNQALQDYYKYMSTPQYDQMQDYYAGNYQDYYGGGSESQDPQYFSAPATTTTAAAPAATTAAPVGITDTGLGITGGGSTAPTYAGVQSSQALTGQALYNAQMAQSQAREQASPAYRAPAPAAPAPAAPAPAPAPSMSDQFITRYERAEATGNDNPKVKTVAPVKTIAKPATPVKVWGNRNN